jgi:hypothetical protein
MKSLSALALILLPVAALGQTKGLYKAFGSGCGTPGIKCEGHDPKGTSHRATPLPNEYAYPFTTTKVSVLTGVRFYTRVVITGNVHTVKARAFKALATGEPSGVPFEETLMTVGSTSELWQASFNKLTLLQPGKYFVSFEPWEANSVNAPAVIYSCEVPNGTVTRTGSYWRRPTAPAWTLTGVITKPWFEVLCAGSTPILLSNTGVPEIGKSYSFDMTQGQSGSLAIGVLGLSNKMYGAIPLPFSLNLIAPGCWLFTGLDVLFPSTVDQMGKATTKFPIPNAKPLVGFKIYNQYLMNLRGANVLDLLFSNGGEGTIGG